ncbi:MAG: hypothetical protein ABL989_17095 [Gammaproteobacteria bacterium]
MELSNPHNLRTPPPEAVALRFGIRVTMPPLDPLRRVLGNDWHKEHWFPTREERDSTLAEMARRHNFSRIGDTPSIRLDAIER